MPPWHVRVAILGARTPLKHLKFRRHQFENLIEVNKPKQEKLNDSKKMARFICADFMKTENGTEICASL